VALCLCVSIIFQKKDLFKGVFAAGVPGVAPDNSFDAKPQTPKEAIFFKSLDRVIRTGRIEAARFSHKGA
jgi:hypothetical protein